MTCTGTSGIVYDEDVTTPPALVYRMHGPDPIEAVE